MQYKLKHRLSAALMAGAMCCTMIPAASADEIATPETAEAAAAEATNQVEQPVASGGGLSVEEIQSRMYPSLPQTATGYYLDSTGLPVLTGETKISIEGWGNEDYSAYDADSTIQVALDEALLNTDSATASFPRMDGEDYAIVPISMQVLYPANGGSADITLPDNVELLGYNFTSDDLCSATEEERQRQLHYDFSEGTASVAGIYVKATEDFSVTLTYTDSEKSLTKALHVTLDDSAPFPGILQDRFAQEAQPATCSADAGVAAYAGLQVTQCVYTSVGWMNYLGGQPALCADSGKWAWGPGATYANKYPPVANYSSAGSVWVLAEFFGKGWTADQATMWAQGFNSGAPSAVFTCAAEDATDNNAYLDRLAWQAEQFPDSLAGEIVNGAATYADDTAETVYIGTLYVPSNAAWQRFVILDYTPVTLGGDNEIPELTPEGQPIDKPWSASYERTETLDFSYTINTNKIQLETLEKVDGAGIDIAPILDGIPSDINGGSWTITPAGKQSVTTSGHTQDNSYHLNGGDASATWTVHYSVSKSASQSGSVTTNSEQDADAQASAAQSAAQSACESQVNGEIEAALSAVHGYFDSLKFSYDEVTIPHGFDSTPGALGSHQTITVPANSSNDYKMQNDEWSVKVSIDKIDSETKQRIKGDAEFKIFEWDTVRQCYIPAGGYNQYKVERQSDGTYRVSLLSKADQFTKNADGSYDAASILDAYRKSSYDQDTLKFDFSSEEQAIATMYESDTAAVTRYNATLTADGDFANGQGLGWVPTNNAQEYRLSEIFTNEEGILRVQGLPYGQYIVVETTVPKDVFQAEPFLVTVNASSPQSSFTVPAGSITTPSGSNMTYNILDEELEGYLQLVKIDIETGKPVKIADTAFNLYYIAEGGHETLVEMNDPKSGNAWAKTSTFYTDSNGEMKTPEKLPLGKYRIVEVEGPRGYFNDRQYNVVFELTSDRVYQVSGGSADGMDDYVVTENYYNHETLGQIKICKIGNVLTGYENGQFVYETDNLANATYEIHAQGDIPTPDNQGTLWYADGDLVATVTTAEDGQVDEVRFSPTRTTATYDFLKVTHDGTKGEVTITLPLGTYTISEVQAPYGFVHTDHTYTVVLDWDNQYNDLVLAKTIIDHTQDGDVVYDYSIINVGNASAEQIEKQILVFENARVLPVVDEGKVGVGLYKLDRDTCDLTDEAPYADGCKTRVSLLNGGSNRADIPADAKMVAGAVYELYTADDIYSISGELLAVADTLLGTAATDENGLAYFDVDVPLRGEHYSSSEAHDWTTNSGRYYLREVSVPDGYLIEQSVIPVEFTYENQFIAWQVVDCLHSDKQTTVEIDKRAFTSDSDNTFALPGATLTVIDWNGNVVDTWESGDTPHVIRGLHLSHDFVGNRDTSKIYTLTETRPADGYTTARSIQFRLEQATDGKGYLQETAVWVLRESEDAEYRSGSIISPTAFSDDTVVTIPAKLRAFWDKLMGKNPDADGVVIANWYCVNGTLMVNFTDAANDRAIVKCLRERDFDGLTFDKVYLTGAAAPAFFADKQVAEKPADAEITYSASWILLKDSDGFSQTLTMLDAPTRVKISKADITNHEEIPGATLRVLDKDGNVVDEWVSEKTPHYMEAVLIAGETYTLEETLVPDNSGYVPTNAIQFMVEDGGKVQHVFMHDDYTKVQISKTDIATGKEISGAKLKITDTDGKTIAEWVTDGTPHYMERIPMGTYTLTETMAPTEQGYIRAESVTFEVGPTGDIQRVEMKDDITKVEISKADMTDGRELPGAKLKITDASGNTITEWETNGQPHRIERLKPGDYTLIETTAPTGYLLSEEVHFTVQETGEIQKVTMYDAPAHSLILTKRDIATNAKLADARLTIRNAYGTTIDRWTTTDGDHAIRVLPECSAAKDPHKNLLLLSDDTSEHVYTMVEELAPNSYLVAESITFKVMQMNDDLVVFVWQDGGWQKSSEGYLGMYDERTDTPVPLMKTFPQTGSIL